MKDFFHKRRALMERLQELEPAMAEIAEAIARAVAQGHTIFACGNGGSAAMAQHFTSELVGRFQRERRSLPSVCFNSDTSVLTCLVNDYGIEAMFRRQVEGLMRPGDVLLCFSTSGNSANVVAALQRARELGHTSVALLGRDGGKAKGLATWELIVPEQETALIQEAHLAIVHYICTRVDAEVIGGGAS